MDSRKFILNRTLTILCGQIICVALMCGAFALIGKFDGSVVFGGVVGGLLSTLNFLFLGISADKAADQAVEQNVKAGTTTIRLSYGLRFALIFAVLFAFGKSGLCNVFAMALPLAFAQPILMVTEFFRKAGEKE